MPGSTGIGEGLDNKEGKRMKYSDAQPQEVEEEKTEARAKEVTNKGSELFSTAKPSCEQNSEIQQQRVEEGETEVASDTKRSGFDRTIAKASGGKNIALLLQLKNQEEDSVIQQQEREREESKVATNSTGSDSGDTSENGIGESELPNIFLFKLRLARSNRLVVPVEFAADFFPSLSVGADAAKVLQITDYRDDEWNMSLTYYIEESVFMFTKGWAEFAAWHNLEAMDVIRFYRPEPRLSPHHYLILHERRQENLATTPEFRRENFLFRIELNTADIGYCRLFIPGREVEIHFPAIKQIHGTRRKKEIAKFTDAGNKNWYMDIIRYDAGSYMIMDGWDEFVKEHRLEAMDSIRFYKPVHPSHKKHFLVEIARKVEAETNPTQSAAASFVDGGSSCDLSRRRGRPIRNFV
ncbi:hypothetical protein RHGRI_002717 [Rhododendron griersonianum]|uniref:TF-B3 domain-containing protein n=1 Tax=Rhododendron griersonianum TaxID=479676 RepID=A0AAV6LTA3_9ERIC|nr:hypothetical protein RHGRI_002717 [Rhododendron griersonianum]